MTCDGCGGEIVEGQHYMEMRIRLNTRTPERWLPVRDVEPTEFDLRLHHPGCFGIWVNANAIIRDVFSR